MGFYLFIRSEVAAFLRVFWALLHSALSPNVELGNVWPARNMKTVSPLSLALIGRSALLSSGCGITTSHYALLVGRLQQVAAFLTRTIVKADVFSYLQGYEYKICSFDITDSVLGRLFFTGTGLHGIHIWIGNFMLTAVFALLVFYRSTIKHHRGFNVAAIYWHFVDIMWLLIYGFFYLWPNQFLFQSAPIIPMNSENPNQGEDKPRPDFPSGGVLVAYRDAWRNQITRTILFSSLEEVSQALDIPLHMVEWFEHTCQVYEYEYSFFTKFRSSQVGEVYEKGVTKLY